MRVLVTGATGFTGGHLARALARRGHHVRALVRSAQAAADLAAAGIELVVGDLQDPGSLTRAVESQTGDAGKTDIVYHVAAVYRQAGISTDTYRAVNATAVRDIIAASAWAGVRRVVHCSTVGVHGDVEHPPANEDAPFRPGDVYQDTKLEGERLARQAASDHGIEVTIVRPSGIYGPRDRRLLKLFRGVSRRRWVTLGAGNIYYHLTYIDDLVEGFRLCGEHPAAANRTYILAGAEVTTLNELVSLIADVARVPPPTLHVPVWPFWMAAALCEAMCVPFGIEPPIYRRRVDFFTKSRAFDITRARREIGTLHKSDRERASDAPSNGTGTRDGSDVTPNPQRIAKAQDQLFARGTSSSEKYAALVVGRPGLGALIKHELVVTLAQSCPGALGLALRRTLYPTLLGACGRNVVFGQNVVLRHPHKIRIGDNVVIDDNCLLDAKGDTNHGILIGSGVFVGRNTIFSCKNGDIEIADGANIGFNCELFSASRVFVGHDVLIAAYVYVIGGDHDFSDPSMPVLEQSRTSRGVSIGDGAWLGAGAKVLDGVTIGARAVIGAGAVVRSDVEASAVAVGVPARVVSSRDGRAAGPA